MQALKALVIGLGILIVVAFTVMVTTLAQRSSKLGDANRLAPFAAQNVALPAGMRIVEMTAAGERIVLRLEGANGAARLLLLDPANGNILGTVDLAPAP